MGLLAGPEPHRARLGQAESRVAPYCRAYRRGAASGSPPRTRHHHRPGRGRLLPSCRVQPSQVTCGLLYQAIWLLAQGRTFLEVGEVMAFAPRWLEELAA